MTETHAHELLQAAYESREIDPFDLAAERWGKGDEMLAEAKTAAGVGRA